MHNSPLSIFCFDFLGLWWSKDIQLFAFWEFSLEVTLIRNIEKLRFVEKWEFWILLPSFANKDGSYNKQIGFQIKRGDRKNLAPIILFFITCGDIRPKIVETLHSKWVFWKTSLVLFLLPRFIIVNNLLTKRSEWNFISKSSYSVWKSSMGSSLILYD